MVSILANVRIRGSYFEHETAMREVFRNACTEDLSEDRRLIVFVENRDVYDSSGSVL